MKPAYFILKHVVSKNFIFKKSVQGCILPRMKKSMALFHIKILCCVTLATFKKENFNVWVTNGSYVGHILWVSGLNESTDVTHFQP